MIMAAQRVRPSSFIVLDEVDAPLDDANVERLMRVICDPSMPGQYILITHNKQTIQYADAIYGVSLRQGVSRLISMRLDEARKVIEREEKRRRRKRV